LDVPKLSTATPEDVDQSMTGFRPDAEGDYTFQLSVTNSQGVSDTCQTRVTAKAFLGLWIEATSSAPGDVALHRLHPLAGHPPGASTWFSLPYDCYYSNQNPFWDSLGRADDPFLERDDEGSTGPEIIRIDAPSTEHSYDIGVHWFGS